MSDHPNLADIEAAADRIGGRIRRTRLLASGVVPVLLKLECEQETGSFKLRGATNKLLAKVATWIPAVAGFLDPVFGTSGLLKALGVAVGLSAIGALLPAWRAAGISPVEALRYE